MGRIADIAGEIEVTEAKLSELKVQLAAATGLGTFPATNGARVKTIKRTIKFKGTGASVQVVKLLEREPRRVFKYGEILDQLNPKNRKSVGATIYALGVRGRIKKLGDGKYKAAPAK